MLALYVYSFSSAHIFVYHRFDDTKHNSTSTSIKELIKEFEYFKKNNYKVVPLEKILRKIKNKHDIPNNWIALNIDDSYKSFYDNGLEIFKKYNYPFTLYVYIKATNKKYSDFMTWDEVRETSKYGTVALHSYGHEHLTHQTKKSILKTTKKAYDTFVKQMKFKPKTYAYPYGEYDTKVKEVIKSFGFDAILNQSIGSVSKHTDIYDIPRIALVGKVNIKHKLRYETLNAKWIEPNFYPKNGILSKIKAKVNPKIKKLKLYITKYGWRDIKVKNGLVDEVVNLKLKKNRTRVMLGTNVFTISNKILIKNPMDEF